MEKLMVGIIDYGLGNITSIENSLRFVGFNSYRLSSPEEFRDGATSALVLPGVGSFDKAMQRIRERKLDTIARDCASGMPLVGICLGMHMLFEESSEGEGASGLGLLSGQVTKLPNLEDDLRVPSIGWRQLSFNEQKRLAERPKVYFVHSYFATDIRDSELVATYRFGSMQIPAIVSKGSTVGFQFHPERSSYQGLQLLEDAILGRFGVRAK